MPMTLIPPAVPAMIIKFDEEKGAKEVLKVVKTLFHRDKPKNNSPFADLAGMGTYVYYAPLKKINRAKVVMMAKELNYSDDEIQMLKEELTEK